MEIIVGVIVISVCLPVLLQLQKRNLRRTPSPNSKPQRAPKKPLPPPDPTPHETPAVPDGVVLGTPVKLTLPHTQVVERAGIPMGDPIRLPPPPPDPLWHEKGWRKNENGGYEGVFIARGTRYKGYIKTPYPGSYEPFVWRPPLTTIHETHKPCFVQPTNDGRYKVHFKTAPRDLSDAIRAVEYVLNGGL